MLHSVAWMTIQYTLYLFEVWQTTNSKHVHDLIVYGYHVLTCHKAEVWLGVHCSKKLDDVLVAEHT